MKTPRLVLDTNCLIDLEERRSDAVYLDRLIASYRNGALHLAVAAISASENQPGAPLATTYLTFVDRLRRIDLSDVEQLMPLATWNVGYWDHMLWSSDALDQLAETVRAALFTAETPSPSADLSNDRKWRNRHCDAMVAWCCIYHDWPELVTRDENFHRHKSELAALGLRAVWSPQEAADRYAP